MATKRLIDANDALERLKKAEQEMKVVTMLGCKVVPMYGVIDFIASRPAVDAVEVVRCKDCKHSKLDDVIYRKTIDGETNDTTLYCCFYHWNYNEWNKGEHFCSYGERKDND